MKFLCNKDRNSYELCGITVTAKSAVKIEDDETAKVEQDSLGKELLRKGKLYFADKYPDEFKTTGQQLTEALTANADNSKALKAKEEEYAALKAEAEQALEQRDREIEELKAQLAAAKASEGAE